LSQLSSHPLGNNSEFHEISPNPNASGFAWRDNRLFFGFSKVNKHSEAAEQASFLQLYFTPFSA
jgi:hypothetical protein